jgi:hypothetical protein
MKTVAYTLYVVIVLLISGLARANAMPISTMQTGGKQTQYQTPVQVSQVALDQAKAELQIAGSLPNPCYADPSALLTQDLSNPSVLVLRLSSPIPMDACISRVKYFDTNVELLKLVQASHLKLDGKTVYTLKVDGSEFALEVPGSELIISL